MSSDNINNAQFKKTTFCNYGCSSIIKFDNSRRSIKGRTIPLNLDATSYDCPSSPFNKAKQRHKIDDNNTIRTTILFKRYNQVVKVELDRNYSIDIFGRFLNAIKGRNKKHRHLLKIHIVSLVLPDIDDTVLTTYGPKDAAKSFLLGLIKTRMDHGKPTLLTLQKNISEFIHEVNHNYLLSFYDNVKFIPNWFSDEICKAVMGIGHKRRKVCSDTLGFGFLIRFLYRYRNEEGAII
jgi:hypothetical protein